MRLGVLSGNTKEFSDMWLKGSGLLIYFPEETWSLGTEWKDRAEGIVKGREKCERYYKTSFEKIIVVGDSDKEIKAANGARGILDIPVFSVSVATGDHSFEELKALGADAVFHDFSDFKNVAERLAEI